MAYSNGLLPNSALGPITLAANGEQAYLRKDAAAAFMAMNAESEKRFDVTLRVSSARTAYRTVAQQQYFWSLYVSGRGNLAARPGTSNHGWGLAVDLATRQMRDIVDRIGEKYGWAKKWSDAPSEWWHVRWRPGVWKPAAPADPVLRMGTTNGPSVLRLQKMLRGLHLATPLDGKYGIITRRSVRRFQQKHGIVVDGVVGPKTWDKLRKASG